MYLATPQIAILGLGYKSTHYYINQLNKEYLVKNKEFATFPYYMYQANFNTINPYLPNQFHQLKPTLQHILCAIQKLPVNFLLVPNITLHETLDQLDFNIKLIHPLELTLKKLHQKKINDIVLFGTKYSMNAKYMTYYFENLGVNVSKVTKKDQTRIENLRQHLYSNNVTQNELSEYIDLAQAYKHKTIVVCCTELSIINENSKLDHIIDMAKLQISEALKLQA